MGSQVVKGKMQISAIGLSKGFTILEILIVLTIISISGTSFYLILNQPKNFNSYEQIFQEYMILSMYSGNTYGFTSSSINVLNEGLWESIKSENFGDIYSVTDTLNKEIVVEDDDEIFMIISSGYETTIKSLTLKNGEIIEI